MPEYLALTHHFNNGDDAEQSAPTADDVTDMFLKMERAGIGSIN